MGSHRPRHDGHRGTGAQDEVEWDSERDCDHAVCGVGGLVDWMGEDFMTKHTPGPWESSRENYSFLKRELTIFSITTNDCVAKLPSAWVNKQANARLIAAAPELLEALDFCLSAMGAALVTGDVNSPTMQKARKAARAAIAKAEGGGQ